MRNPVRELESSDDSELLASTRQGHDAAFGELYRRHVGAARAAARSLTRSSTDAEDAVAEAFARVLSVMRRGGGPEVALRPYLMTVVRNVCYDRASARNRESLPGETEVMAALDDHPTYQSADLDQFTESNLVSRAFASLSDRWKQVLWQTDIEGRSPRDLAEELELAPTAVAALAFRAREGLADAYLAAHVQYRPTALCDREPAELARYVRNRMRSKEQLTFGAHLAQCSRCTEAVAELRVVSLPLRSLEWPALIGTPVIVYGGKVIGVIRRVVTAQFLTTAGAAAVTVATVTVVDRVPFEPFDALRPKAYVEAKVADAPRQSDAATVVATTDSSSGQRGRRSNASAPSASVPDALGLPTAAGTDDSASAATATATEPSATPTTALIGPAVPTDTTVAPAPAPATTNPGGTAPPDTTAPEKSGGKPAPDTTPATDPSVGTGGPVKTEPTIPAVTPPPTPAPSGTGVPVVLVVGGAATQSAQPPTDVSTTTTTGTTTSTTTPSPVTTVASAATTSTTATPGGV